MLIGKSAFDAEDIDELVEKIEKGDYTVPKNLSKEIVSFLNGMLQYNPNIRLSSAQLINHRFLTENINNFHKINLSQVSDKINQDQLKINTKKNQTIWAIFNEENEDKLAKISPGQIEPKNNSNVPQQNSLNPFYIANNSSTNTEPVKSYNTYDNKEYPNMNNMNYYNQNNSQNYGPILPNRDNSPIYINQKFDKEVDYTFRGGIYG